MIKFSKLKASTLCASGALLVLGGFMTVNLAGCGGGGGGGLVSPTPRPINATFRIVQQDSSVSRGGSLTLTRGSFTQTAQADGSGLVTFPSLSPGTYTATYTAFDSSGNSLPPTTRTIVVSTTGDQNYTLVQGDNGGGPFSITGRILLNPSGSNDPDNSPATGNCTTNSVPITASLLISVRDLNSVNGTPIIAQLVRPAQSDGTSSSLRGRYTISLPFRPTSFRVEVTQAPNSNTPFAGISATTTFVTNTTSIDSVDVCTNINGVIPAPQVTATPVFTNTPFTFITPTPSPSPTVDPTAGPVATATALATATADPAATATSVAGATATAGPGATATAGPIATATSAAAATATAVTGTSIAGTGGSTPTPTSIIANRRR